MHLSTSLVESSSNLHLGSGHPLFVKVGLKPSFLMVYSYGWLRLASNYGARGLLDCRGIAHVVPSPLTIIINIRLGLINAAEIQLFQK